MEFLDILNPQQRKAVTASDGPVMVLAGPGSGKTRVLTQRIAYLISYEGVRPYQMLAVTFTNKAAREMENRVQQLLGEEMTRGLTLGTFHSICARILRRENERLPVSSDFVIFDADDQQKVVKNAIRELNLNEKLYRPVAMHAAIGRAKNELIRPDDYPVISYRDEAIKRIYQKYQELLYASNGIDFDDLLVLTAFLMEENPDIREKYAQRFKHVLVDEFQDTNIAQYTLLKHLSSFHQNIFCVGDADQSVYRWRGADYRNIQRFEQNFPACQTILLEQNYRSRQLILDTAMAVIDKAPHRRKKKLFSDRGTGEKVSYFEALDDYGEASFVVDAIAQLVATKQAEPGDCAVMYRTNSMSRLLEEAFLQARLPYRLVGAQRFYGRREVKDIIAYLRLVFNPDDEISLDRVINLPPRGIGDKSLQSLKMAGRSIDLSAGKVALSLAAGDKSPYWEQFSGRAALALAEFGSLLQKWRAHASTATITELFDLITQDIQYAGFINDDADEGKDRWENVQELRRLTEEYDTRTLGEFLENVALVSDQDTLSEGNVPTLLTLHAAKGLEFGVVFIVGLDDGILPHSRSFSEPEEMEEERRLFYVGITRAKEKLFLVRAMRRGGRGFSEETIESRFLDDIPSELITGKGRVNRGQSFRRQTNSNWTLPSPPGSSSINRSAPVLEAKYRAGMRVKHPSWDEGIILNSRIQDGDEILDVVFESVGIKRLAASLAKLEIVH